MTLTAAQVEALEVVLAIAHQSVAREAFMAERPPTSRHYREWAEGRDAVQTITNLLVEHGLWFADSTDHTRVPDGSAS